MKNYKQFTISFSPFRVDIVSGALWELDILGLLEDEDFLEVFSKDDSSVTSKKISEILNNLIAYNLIEIFKIEENVLEHKNWNAEWEKKIGIIKVTENIIIKPSFKKYAAKPGELVITIDPKMSFGTGEHQTTKLVLKLLANHLPPNAKVLDVGSGTAILGIAASLLGARNVLCVDNDELCLENGNENIEVNKVQKNVNYQLGEISQVQEKDFDLILANINKHILLEIDGEIRKRIKKTGKIILSGLLKEDNDKTVTQYHRTGFNLIGSEIMDEWLALVFTPK